MNDLSPTSAPEQEEDLTALVSAGATPATTAAVAAVLPPLLASLVAGIEEPAPRRFMRDLFTETFKLLSQVGRLRDAVEQGGAPDGVQHVLAALKRSSAYLLTNIETAELRVEGLPDALTEALEAASFALRHESRRVFEAELGGARGGQTTTTQSVLRACALLENCFQQLTVCLARAFAPGLTGAAVFESYRRRREESLTLRLELQALLISIRAAEREFSVLTSLALLKRVNRFCDERLHFLNYKDWEDFERFADALELSYESDEAAGPLLHKFSCYVEALLSQVQLRAVLADD